MAIRSFKGHGDLTLEDISLLALDLVEMPLDSDSFEVTELKTAIYECSEVGRYIRQIPEIDHDGEIMRASFLTVMNYYEQNKAFLDNWISSHQKLRDKLISLSTN